MMSFIDRVNVGTAKLTGRSGMTDRTELMAA